MKELTVAMFAKIKGVSARTIFRRKDLMQEFQIMKGTPTSVEEHKQIRLYAWLNAKRAFRQAQNEIYGYGG